MTLTCEFVENPVTDLAEPEFQDRLRKALSWSPFSAITAALGGLVSAGVLICSIWTVVGHLIAPQAHSFLGTSIITVVGVGGAIVLGNLLGRWKRRRSYQALLASPGDWRLESAVVTRVSRLAFPTIGSDQTTLRIFWAGDAPGAASVEKYQFQSGNGVAVAVKPGSAPLLISRI